MLRRVLLVVVPLLALAGCKSGEAPTPGFQRLAVLPALEPITASDISRPTTGEWSYEITRGVGHGTRTVIRRSATDQHDADWMDQIGERRTEFWRIDDDGSHIMTAVIEHDRGAITFFSPPLVIAPAELMPGEPFEQQVNMRVMDLDNPRKQRYAGTAHRTMQYVDTHVLQTPIGRMSAARVEITFRADLRMAGADTESTKFIYPSYGSIVEHIRDRYRVMKMPVHANEQWLVLRSTMEEPGG